MINFKMFVFTCAFLTTISACGGGSSNSGNPQPTTLDPLSCSGNRVWDLGESDNVQQAQQYISESSNQGLGVTRFPCTIFWEFVPGEPCATSFSYEAWIQEFNTEDLLQELGTSGGNLVAVENDGTRSTFVPAGVSLADLDSYPTCEFTF